MALQDTKQDLALADIDHVEGKDLGTVEHDEFVGQFAEQEAHEETPWQALKSHPWSSVWVVYGIGIIIACSFDNNAGGNVISIPRFRQDYGSPFDGNYVLPAQWQSAYSGGPAASSVFGTFGGSYISDKIGRKWTMAICYVLLFAGITVEVISHNQSNPNAVFFAGKLINGFAIGGLLATALTYIGEIAPLALRGILLALSAIAFTVGGIIITLIINSFGTLDSEWAYKSCFVAQYGVTGIVAAFWIFMPESPTWLLSRGRDQHAAQALKRMGHSQVQGEKAIATIKLTLERARAETAGVTYLDCFKKSNLRRTIIASMPLSIQAFCGVFWVAGFSTYYMQLAGYSTAMSFKLGIVQQVISMIGNLCACVLIERVGRRALTLWGIVALTILLMVTGGLACVGTPSANKGTVALILFYCWLYNVTIGATAYVALAEIGTSRLRAKTASIAIGVQGCFSCMWNFVLPYLFNPDQANLGAKTAFIFGGFSIFCCVYLYFYHPETKGRSYQELDELFAKGVPARQFASYVTDAQTEAIRVKQRVQDGELSL